jgi:thermitase
VSAALVCAVGLAAAAPGAQAASRVVVRLSDARATAGPAIGADPDVTAVDRDTGLPGTAVLTVASQAAVAGVVGRLQNRDDVAWVAPEKTFQYASIGDDPLLGRQWNLAAVSAPAAWRTTLGAADARVAVVDSGFPAPNRDLAGALAAPDGGDAVTPDVDGHATAVAGVLAARTGDGFGLAGIAPAARLTATSAVADDGSLTDVSVAAGLRRAALSGVKVINLSIVGPYSSAVDEVLAGFPDVLFVVSAGNGGEDADDYGDASSRPFPCGSDLDNVLCVGATDQDGHRSSYSNYGTTVVDVSAPGDDVLAPAFAEGDVLDDHADGTDHGAWQVAGGTLSGNGDLRVTPDGSGEATLRTKALLPVSNSDCQVTFRNEPAASVYTLARFADAKSPQGAGETTHADGTFTFPTGHLAHDAWLEFSNTQAFGIDDVHVHCRFPAKPSELQTTVSGTSFSAPMVAGAADLVLARHPDWAAAQVSAAITCTAAPAPGVGGSGLLDAAAAVSAQAAPLRPATAGRVAILHPVDELMGSAVDPTQMSMAPTGDVWDSWQGQGLIHVPPGGKASVAVAQGAASTGDGGPAKSATVKRVHAVTAMPDGGVVFGDEDRLRRIWPDGHIDTVAVTGTPPEDVAVAPDGGYAVLRAQYGAPSWTAVVDRIDSTGTIHAVRTVSSFEGAFVASASDGSLFIYELNRIVRVFPDGHDEPVAGDGRRGAPTGDGGPATAASIGTPVTSLLMTRRGLLIGLGDGRVRIVRPDGTMGRFAGTGGVGSPTGGQVATAAPMKPLEILGEDAEGALLAAGGAIVRVDDAQVAAPPLPPRCADVAVGQPDGGGDGPGAPGSGTPAAPSGDQVGGGAVAGTGTVPPGSGSTRPTTTATHTRAASASATLRHRRLVLRVVLPRNATVVVRCRGRGCSARHRSWKLTPGTHRLTVTTTARRPDVTVAITIAGKPVRAWRLRAGRVRVTA